ncbi:hypothetical protein EV07_0955 [Prochlorococcus sp. MIT 0603]|nr:hypothetical protein EV07_0955 [Prochlorococcus sp. MIT 0603]
MDQLIYNFQRFTSNINSSSYITILILSLLVFITLSIAYLTFIDFKDKRRNNIG